MNEDKIQKVVGNIIGGILGICFVGTILGVTVLYSIWAYAYVGNILWEWFMVPIFGLPALTLAKAFGISILVRLWTLQYFTSKDKDERDNKEKIMELVGRIISPWYFLLMGWIAKIWMG